MKNFYLPVGLYLLASRFIFTLLGQLCLFSENINMCFADGSCDLYLVQKFQRWAGLLMLSNQEKSPSHVLHLFTVIKPPQQQCFS